MRVGFGSGVHGNGELQEAARLLQRAMVSEQASRRRSPADKKHQPETHAHTHREREREREKQPDHALLSYLPATKSLGLGLYTQYYIGELYSSRPIPCDIAIRVIAHGPTYCQQSIQVTTRDPTEPMSDALNMAVSQATSRPCRLTIASYRTVLTIDRFPSSSRRADCSAHAVYDNANSPIYTLYVYT